MIAEAKSRLLTPEEYMALERASEYKHEYYNSDSTEHYDRGDKFESYRTIESLTNYVLVAQDRLHVEYYVRQPDGAWLFSEFNRPEQIIEIRSISCGFSLEDVYEKVEFDPVNLVATNGNVGEE